MKYKGVLLRVIVEFRDCLNSVGGLSEKLPKGSFKDSDRSTGVNTRLIVITKQKYLILSYQD